MASRDKRQINYLPDQTSGTVTISHGSPSKPQNGGFFGGGFTNTTSRSGSKRRRLRLADKQRRENEARQQEEANRQAAAQALQAAQAQREAEARAAAEAQARAQAEAQARAQALAHAEAQAKAAAEAQAERERAQVAHQQAVASLSLAHPAIRADLDGKYATAQAGLTELLQSEIQSQAPPTSSIGQQLHADILKEKARINYLIAQKAGLREQKMHSAHSFAGADPRGIDSEHYKEILLSRTTTAEQAQQVHEAWATAYADALDGLLLSESEVLLNDRSESLSERYAEQAWAVQNELSSSNSEELSVRQASELSRLWSVVAGPGNPTQEVPTARDKATEIAKKLFVRQALRTFARTLPHIASFYPTELGNGEMAPAVLATSASTLGISSGVDLGFIASRHGTIDVTHRLSFIEAEGGRAVWAETDGVTVGTQVRVRSLVFNPHNNTYEFIRDGETSPSLVWTPAITPDSSSTCSPSEAPVLPLDLGSNTSPISTELGEYPTFDQVDFDDYIITFPADSGLGSLYAVFSQRAGDHQYYVKPKTLPAFPEAVWAKGKTAVHGGGGVRHRWLNSDGKILEWDSYHGKIELYNKQGKHLGEFDHETGVQTKPADPARRVEP